MPLNSSYITASAYAVDPAQHLRLEDDKPLVLVVEDHEDTRFMLKIMLEKTGCRVTEAADGVEAIESACRLPPNLILMDGSLRRLDGLETTRRLREHGELKDVPIIAISGHATPEFHARALAAGCNDCIFKPINFKQLEIIINRLFEVFPDNV